MKFRQHVKVPNPTYYRKLGVHQELIHFILYREMLLMKLYNFYYECLRGIREKELPLVKHSVKLERERKI